MHTVEQAKECWCPFSRAAYPILSTRMRPDIGEHKAEMLADTVVGNRPIEPNNLCVASECMAWRWAEHQYEWEFTDNEDEVGDGPRWLPDTAPPKPDGDGWEPAGKERKGGSRRSQTWKRSRSNRRGYCGLAGQPS